MAASRAARIVAAFGLALLATGGALVFIDAQGIAAAPEVVASNAAAVNAGAMLARIGNCANCHTSDGGKSFSGGRPLPTPFGTIYSTNITPDPETGIGRYSAADFRRAMQEGIRRDGAQLYPVFPYDHYTHVSDADVDAIYAFLMTRDPVRYEPPGNSVLLARPLVGVWKALYFKPGPLAPDASQDAEWNRGRYLAEGLGHCSACHTPRNALGAEEEEHAYAGGTAEGWSAPALNVQSPAPRPWTVAELTTYLSTGFDSGHGVAAGVMAPVTENLARVPSADVRAVAVYVAWQMRGARAERLAPGAPPAVPSAVASEDAVADPVPSIDARDGAAIYATACAGCHERARRGISLALSTTLTDTTPTNLIRITFDGIPPREGEKAGIMPAFRGALDDAQMTALADYLRARIANGSAWRNVEREVAKARTREAEKKS